MTWSSTGAKHQPALDETSFQQLLSAAYVVQQHNDTAQNEQTPGRSQVLAVIAEIQSLIRTQSLNIADGCALIGERALTLTGASGVSISLVDNGYLDCVAEAGVPAKIPGSSLSSHSKYATEQLKSGHMFESEDSQTDSRLEVDACLKLGVGSLVAAPVLRFGEIAGLVEVRWAKPHAFGESELRTCRLMAGLVTGTLERSVRIGNARTTTAPIPRVETEASAQTVSEDVAPSQNAAPQIRKDSPLSPEPAMPLADTPAAVAQPPEAPPPSQEANEVGQVTPEVSTGQVAKRLSAPSCRMCGRPFAGDEQFCGFCSMPRPVERQTEELQSKWASLWFMQRAQGILRATPALVAEVKDEQDELRAESIPDLFPSPVVPSAEQVEPKPLMWPRRAPPEPAPESEASSATGFVAPEIFSPFDERPALSVRVGGLAKRYWRNAILATLAMVLAYGLMLAWPKPGQQNWYQALMVRLGVHKATKVFAGTPDTRVWIDVHTQLYYCSGEDLYGKTPDGEFTTQYNAQSDGFLPASNTTCP